MFKSILIDLIDNKVKTFAKLTHGDPYRFYRWDRDKNDAACLYYRFTGKDGVSILTKRLLISEMLAGVQELQTAGVFNRKTFLQSCPRSAAAGSCGFAVFGRILEALEVAVYSGRGGFKLQNKSKVVRLLATL